MKISKHYFIDGTFIHTNGYMQTIIIMYIDFLSGLKIKGIYILCSNKLYEDYNRILKFIKNLLFGEGYEYLNILTITLDFENSLLKALIANFPNTKLVGCFYHYKAAIYRETQKLGYTKKKILSETLNIINSNLSFIQFNIISISDYAINLLKQLRKKYPNYLNYFDYYENFWYRFIENGMLNYKNISKEIRTNNLLENYNGKLKLKLKGKKLLNWKEYVDLLIEEENFYKLKLIDSENNNFNCKIKY